MSANDEKPAGWLEAEARIATLAHEIKVGAPLLAPAMADLLQRGWDLIGRMDEIKALASAHNLPVDYALQEATDAAVRLVRALETETKRNRLIDSISRMNSKT